MRRLNKEYRLDICKNVSLKYGTVNKDNPQVIYISGKCWVCPLKKMDYVSVINKIEKDFRNNIKLFLTDKINFENKYILDFDICAENLSLNESKFLSFDLFLKQNEDNKKKLKDLKELLGRKVNTIINNLLYIFEENNFNVGKKKAM